MAGKKINPKHTLHQILPTANRFKRSQSKKNLIDIQGDMDFHFELW
jgi:hypothetical protein